MADEDPKSHPPDYAEKDPDTWVSGEDSMTGAQASYLKTLSEQADDADAYDDTTSKAEASKRIDALKSKLVKEAELYAERLDTYAGFSSITTIISPGGIAGWIHKRSANAKIIQVFASRLANGFPLPTPEL